MATALEIVERADLRPERGVDIGGDGEQQKITLRNEKRGKARRCFTVAGWSVHHRGHVAWR